MAGRGPGLLDEIEIAVGVDPAATLRKLKIRRHIREVHGWGTWIRTMITEVRVASPGPHGER
jgi:hypothetical protein